MACFSYPFCFSCCLCAEHWTFHLSVCVCVCEEYNDYVTYYFLGFTVYIIIDLGKCSVLTLVVGTCVYVCVCVCVCVCEREREEYNIMTV